MENRLESLRTTRQHLTTAIQNEIAQICLAAREEVGRAEFRQIVAAAKIKSILLSFTDMSTFDMNLLNKCLIVHFTRTCSKGSKNKVI